MFHRSRFLRGVWRYLVKDGHEHISLMPFLFAACWRLGAGKQTKSMRKENNIQFEAMPEFASSGKQQNAPIEEREYYSLFDELEEKCNPDRYMNPFVQERFDLANELYAELLKRGIRDDKSLVDIRDKAMSGLGIHVSTHRLYKHLLEYCNPEIYTSMKPYDKERVSEAGRLYALIQKAKDDIHELEAIEKEANLFIQKRRDELLKQEQERQWQQTIEKEKQEKREKRAKGTILSSFGIVLGIAIGFDGYNFVPGIIVTSVSTIALILINTDIKLVRKH